MPSATGVVDTGSVMLGVIAIAMADANHTLVQAEWENGILNPTGALTADRNLILPAALEGTVWIVVAGVSAHNLVFLVAGQTGVTIGPGKTAIVRCSATDIVRVTADV